MQNPQNIGVNEPELKTKETSSVSPKRSLIFNKKNGQLRANLHDDNLICTPKKQSSLSSFTIPSQRFKDKLEETSVFDSVSRKSSQGSKGSKRSQKLAMSCLKLKQPEEKEELLQRRQKLEAEIYERKLKTEMDKLDLQDKIIDARAEMEKCAIESQFSNDEDIESKGDFGEKLSKVQNQTLEETMERYLQSSRPEEFMEKFPATNEPQDPQPKSVVMGTNPELYDLLERQTQLIEGQQATVERLTSSLDLPKREFLHFDGNPTTYLRFIKNFEMNVESRVFISHSIDEWISKGSYRELCYPSIGYGLFKG